MDTFDTGTPVSFLNRVDKLRAKIAARTKELGIATDHDNTGHFYKFNGQRYPSVTGRLQILKDPGLMNWKMNRALEYVQKALTATQQPPLEQIISEAKLAPQQEFEGAGDIGVQVHKWREALFQRWIIEGINNSKIPPIQDAEPQVISGTRAIIKFLVDTHYTPLACELYVADERLELGGQADDIGILNGKVVMIDLKTSNQALKKSYIAQVYLYAFMFQKLYKMRLKGIYILHVSKENGQYELIDLLKKFDYKKSLKWAKRVIEVSKGEEDIREAMKVQPIII